MLAENLYNVQSVQREHRVYTMEKKSKSKQQTLSNGERKLAFATVMAIGAVLLIVIALTAVVATTAYGNNSIEAKNKELRNEIQNLKVSIQEHGSRSQIEKEASQKLGMIYPTSSQFVKIGKHNKETDFANKLKQEAFK